MRYAIKELHVGGILDQAITLVKNHFALLFGITLILMVPFGVLGAVVKEFVLAGDGPPAFPGGQPMPSAGAQLANGLIAIFNGLLIMPLTNAAILHAIASVYLERPVTVGDSFRRALRVFLPLLGTSILVGLTVMLGLILLIIPGLIFAFWYMLSTQIVVIEGVWGSAAMKRSHQLMKGNYGTAIVLGILVFIIQIAMTVGLNFVPQGIISELVSTLVQAVLFVFLSAGWVVFYFSCRCKNENFDLDILADSVGREDPVIEQVSPIS